MAEEDLIFGKNRHFFGGIEPSNMISFSATFEETHVKITAKLPKDTVINNQTLCSVEGAVIRKKTSDYPKNEFDGTKVAVINADSVFTDTDVVSGGTYYYSAFPFTTQGVYNRNKANRTVVNEPQPMKEFSVKSIFVSSSDTSKVEITAKLPEGAKGAVIRKSTSGFPINETDGDKLIDINEDTVHTDNDVVAGTTYYYAAFPYTNTGAYNRSESNRASVTVQRRNYLFGYDLTKATANPATRVSYPYDVDNASYNPAKMIFGDTFDYGDWNFNPGEKFMPKPCMLTYDGVVDHYLNPSDYTLKEGGGTSEIASTTFNGNAMMEWPKIYTKRWEENGIYHFRCSDVPQDDDWDCWCNYDRLNNQIDHFYTPIYQGSVHSGRLRSISGQKGTVELTADSEISYAKANGADWYTEVLADHMLVRDLLVMIGKSTNCQEIFGRGVSDVEAPVISGTMNNKGLFWGANDGREGLKVFGMENPWGNLWHRIAGWIYIGRVQKVKLTRGNHDGTSVNEYNTTGDGYKSLTNSTIKAQGLSTGKLSGYINDMKTEEFGRFHIALDGSSSTYEADVSRIGPMDDRVYYAMIGGRWDGHTENGPFKVSFEDRPTNQFDSYNASVSCKPLKTS